MRHSEEGVPRSCLPILVFFWIFSFCGCRPSWLGDNLAPTFTSPENLFLNTDIWRWYYRSVNDLRQVVYRRRYRAVSIVCDYGSPCSPQLHGVTWQSSAQGTVQVFCFANLLFICDLKTVIYSRCQCVLLDSLFLGFSYYLFIHFTCKEHFTEWPVNKHCCWFPDSSRCLKYSCLSFKHFILNASEDQFIN